MMSVEGQNENCCAKWILLEFFDQIGYPLRVSAEPSLLPSLFGRVQERAC